jgi:prepilin-type N-terminal cleavage/methylation domain-containing protein
MLKTTRRSTAAFTLIELLTVVAIIGILVGISIPAIGNARDRAQRVIDMNNIKQLVQSAIMYANDNKDKFPTVAASTSAAQWGYLVASSSNINDPYIFIAKNDIIDITPPATIYKVENGSKSVDTAFTGLTDLSVAVVAGGKLGDSSTTPLVFTRGLNKSGTWEPTKGVYKDDGGYIGFIGGNVSWFKTTAGSLSQPSGSATDSIMYTISSAKKILSTANAGDAVGDGSGK